MTNAAPADRAATQPTTRRAIIGAGAVGAVLAVTGSRAVGAAVPDSSGDAAIADQAIGFELAARDLYDAAIAAGASDDLWHVLREQHESYAQRVSGIVGTSANTPSATLFDSLSAAFSAAEPVAAAMELESTLAATHTEWLASVTNRNVAIAMASIIALESRHAAVLGIRSGINVGDELFINSAVSISGEA